MISCTVVWQDCTGLTGGNLLQRWKCLEHGSVFFKPSTPIETYHRFLRFASLSPSFRKACIAPVSVQSWSHCARRWSTFSVLPHRPARKLHRLHPSARGETSHIPFRITALKIAEQYGCCRHTVLIEHLNTWPVTKCFPKFLKGSCDWSF